MVGEAEGEETEKPHPLPLSDGRGKYIVLLLRRVTTPLSPWRGAGGEAGSCSRLHVRHRADRIFLLQFHVHHVAVVAHHVLAEELALVAPLVVDFDGLHRVGRQVVEHNGVVATEEVLAVEQQRIDVLAVVVDATALLQLHARQLAHQRVEHRPFSQLEGVGIEDERVAFIIELHLRGHDHHLLQHPRLALHIDGRQFAPLLTAVDIVEGIGHFCGLESHVGGLDDIIGRAGRHLKSEVGMFDGRIVAVLHE